MPTGANDTDVCHITDDRREAAAGIICGHDKCSPSLVSNPVFSQNGRDRELLSVIGFGFRRCIVKCSKSAKRAGMACFAPKLIDIQGWFLEFFPAEGTDRLPEWLRAADFCRVCSGKGRTSLDYEFLRNADLGHIHHHIITHRCIKRVSLTHGSPR